MPDWSASASTVQHLLFSVALAGTHRMCNNAGTCSARRRTTTYALRRAMIETTVRNVEEHTLTQSQIRSKSLTEVLTSTVQRSCFQ